MSWWNRLWRRRQMEEQLEKELRFHLEQHTTELHASGHALKKHSARPGLPSAAPSR